MMKLKDFTKGWIVGDFEPTILQSKDIEVGIKTYTYADYEQRHVHNYITEYTIIVSGIVVMNDIRYGSGDIVVIEPGQSTDFRCVSPNCVTVVIKTPSIPSDKKIIKETKPRMGKKENHGFSEIVYNIKNRV